ILNFSIALLSIFFVITIIAVIAHCLPLNNNNIEKNSPYECGFDPLNSARIPFSFRFFLIAILFLLFDLEIALILPFPSSIFFLNPNTSIFFFIIFLIILTIGLIFEWLQGGLDWAE
uniref:NADH dehydrogenase subunit 3 n=1 Tax=Xyloplax princealberti TaxID=3083365 RepID=UPI002E78DF1C